MSGARARLLRRGAANAPVGLPRRGLIAWHDLYFPNILLQSNTFGATWTTNRCSVIQSASVYAPSGALAWKLVEDDTADSFRYLSQAIAIPLAGTWTVKADFKAAERTWVRLSFYDGTTTRFGYFNLTTGATGTKSADTTTACTARGDFWSCTVTGAAVVGSGSVQVYPGEADNDVTFSGGGSAPYTEEDPGIYIADAQLYPAATLPAYAETTTLQSIPDLSGNGNVLTRGSNASAADTNDPTVLGPGLGFVTDDYCNAPTLTPLNIDGPLTMMVVLKPAYAAANKVPISIAASSGIGNGAVQIIQTANNSMKAELYSLATGDDLSGTVAVTDGSTMCLCLTRAKGTTATLKRMDTGVSATTAEADFADVSVGYSIGDQAVAKGAGWNGTIYSALLYNRELSSAEQLRAYRYLKSQWAARGVTIL